MTRDLTPIIRATLIGQLEQLRDQVKDIARELSDEQLWRKPTEPGNSVGHLILHLTGNLSHFVGAQLGKTGYVRDREKEFTDDHHPTRAELLSGLDRTVATFRRVVVILEAEELEAAHPEQRFGTVLNALVHLISHFALHRGQMTYIARMVK